jgi:hypothetical protein
MHIMPGAFFCGVVTVDLWIPFFLPLCRMDSPSMIPPGKTPTSPPLSSVDGVGDDMKSSCSPGLIHQILSLFVSFGVACVPIHYSLVLSCLVLSCLVLSCLVLSCLVLFCLLVLSCLVLSCFVFLSCLVLSCLVLSCLVVSCLVLSCLVLLQ